MIEITNLHVEINGIEILKGINLTINSGEVHAIMGPNGSGKSTLTKVIAGHPDYKITKGSIKFLVDGKYIDITTLDVSERAKAGVFLGFQYPVEIAGVSNVNFLREAFNEICKHHGVDVMDPIDFNEFLKSKLELLDIDNNFLERNVNEGFSGGEKKKNEILQMAVLNPRLALLDETDSGLDVDSLKIVADGINKLKSEKNSIVLVTHYNRILHYITPDYVHVLVDGKIVKTGGAELAKKIEEKGYQNGN